MRSALTGKAALKKPSAWAQWEQRIWLELDTWEEGGLRKGKRLI